MKVIPAYFEIQDDLDQQSLAVRIEACGRICYKSEDKIEAGSTDPFIEKVLKHGHNSVAEMGVITLRVEIDSETLATQFFSIQPKFVHVDRTTKTEMIITGSVRAYRELYTEHGNVKLIKAITNYLHAQIPLFFKDIVPERGVVKQSGVTVEEITLEEVEKFSADLLAKHRYVGVKIFTNRAVTHEIVRHRPCSYLQESQRYCRYNDEKFGSEVTFIKPMFYDEGTEEYDLWVKAMEETEQIYLKLLETSSPQAARTVLPNSCKTEIIVYCNLLEWLHIFRLRTTKAAEPSMREVMIPLLEEFSKRFPAVFGDIKVAA